MQKTRYNGVRKGKKYEKVRKRKKKGEERMTDSEKNAKESVRQCEKG
jgi:hypothetical protein